MGFLVPARRRGQEILDDSSVDSSTRLKSMHDITRSNRLFGGLRAAVGAFRDGTREETVRSLLDVGTGLGDIPAAIAAAHTGIITIGIDESPDVLSRARAPLTHVVCASARALPFRNQSIDVVVCSQLLHHFSDDDLPAIVRELDRVGRQRVVVADLRRSWIAAAGFWAAAVLLRFHRVTRHDGVLSVLRGFTARELRRTIESAVGA